MLVSNHEHEDFRLKRNCHSHKDENDELKNCHPHKDKRYELEKNCHTHKKEPYKPNKDYSYKKHSHKKKDICLDEINDLEEFDLRAYPNLKDKCCPSQCSDTIGLVESEFCTEIPASQVTALNAISCLKEKDRTAVSKEYSKNVIDFSFLKMKKGDDCFRYLSEQTLLPSEMPCYSEANFSQGTVVQNYCLEVTTQELIEVPDFEFAQATTIQRNAQVNANIWLNSLNRQVVGINTNARQFCNLIISYERDIEFLLDDVIENRPGGVEHFIDEMSLLRDEAYRRSNQINIVNSELNRFRELITLDGAAFAQIRRLANEKYNADTGEIARLRDNMEQYKGQIAYYDALIAILGTVGVFGVLLVIAIGALLLAVPPLGKTIIAAGVTGAGAVVGGVGAAISARNGVRAQYRQAGQEILFLQNTIGLLQLIDDQLTSLIISNGASVRATQAMATGFGILGTNIDGIIDNVGSIIGNAEAGRNVSRMLFVLVENAKDLRELYLDFERQGILPVDVSTRVWNTLFPYRTKAPSKPKLPIPMDEYAVLLQKKVAWQHPLRRRCY